MLISGTASPSATNKIDQPKTSWAPALVIVDSNYAEVVHNDIYNRAGSASRDSIAVYGSNSYNHIAYNHIENSVRYAVDITASSCVGNIVEGNDIVRLRHHPQPGHQHGYPQQHLSRAPRDRSPVTAGPSNLFPSPFHQGEGIIVRMRAGRIIY